MTKKDWALAYASAGWSIFPGRGKEPHYELLKQTGFKVFDPDRKQWTATTKPFSDKRASAAQIEQWWGVDPKADIKLVCGRISGVTVVDIDAKAPGSTPAEDIERELGIVTMRSITGSGKGLHLFCRYTEVKTCTPFSQVEIKNNGSTITLPPSIHPETGREYVWDDLFPFSASNVTSLAVLPPMLVEATRKEHLIPEGFYEAILAEGCLQGRVNMDTTALIGRFLMLTHYMFKDWDKVVPILWEFLVWWNDRQTPKLSEAKLLSTFKSILRREAANPLSYDRRD